MFWTALGVFSVILYGLVGYALARLSLPYLWRRELEQHDTEVTRKVYGERYVSRTTRNDVETMFLLTWTFWPALVLTFTVVNAVRLLSQMFTVIAASSTKPLGRHIDTIIDRSQP